MRREVAAWEIDDNARILAAFNGGADVTFFRTPYGGRCTQIESLLAERALHHLHWDIDPQEYLSHDREATMTYLAGHMSGLRGRAVILLHDTQPEAASSLASAVEWIEGANALRADTGRRPIRILSYADVAREWLCPETVELARHAGPEGLRLPGEAIRHLLGPLLGLHPTPPAPPIPTARL